MNDRRRIHAELGSNAIVRRQQSAPSYIEFERTWAESSPGYNSDDRYFQDHPQPKKPKKFKKNSVYAQPKRRKTHNAVSHDN